MTITYVTITYNAAAVLRRTLDSVLAQDYPDINHLIIDGASTDGTLDIINDYPSSKSHPPAPLRNGSLPTPTSRSVFHRSSSAE